MVRLDGDRRPARKRHALDHVGIERALRQEVGAAELRLLLLEDLDEEPPDGLALRLGVGDAGQRVEEQRLGLDVDQWDVVAVAKQRHHLLPLGQPQQAVVDEHAGELLADRLVDQRRRYG